MVTWAHADLSAVRLSAATRRLPDQPRATPPTVSGPRVTGIRPNYVGIQGQERVLCLDRDISSCGASSTPRRGLVNDRGEVFDQLDRRCDLDRPAIGAARFQGQQVEAMEVRLLGDCGLG